jgi:ABC-2 type transport system ATP-binding protein
VSAVTAIETTDLTKDYYHGFWRKRPRRALDHLTLSVEQGETFALLGPNGAGKTTTLRILLRLTYPTSGTAKILGQPLGDVAVHAKIGYLPEAPYFYDYLTAREFLQYCGQLYGQESPERRKRTNALLERVGLKEAADVALRHYSRGMLQRLGVAQVLINDPELVFLDEPMLGLDPVGRREVRDIILELRARGKTICFSTHVLPDVEALCDRVAILNNGRLHGLGELDEILKLETAGNEVLVGQPSAALAGALQPLAQEILKAGDKLSVRVGEEQLHAVIDCVRQHGGRLLAVHPVRSSLEDYFFEEFGTKKIPDLLDKER